MASLVTIASAIIGFPIAYYMAMYAGPRLKPILYLGVMLPLWSSYLVKVYSWKLIMAKEGILTWFLDKLDIMYILDAILALPVIGGSSLSFSYTGMFLVFVYIWLPYMILPIQCIVGTDSENTFGSECRFGWGAISNLLEGNPSPSIPWGSGRFHFYILSNFR